MASLPKESDIEELALAIGLIVRRIRAKAPPEVREFSWTQKAVLSRLEKGPATAADLARAEGITPQSMASVIASLAEVRLIERKPHPTDGRQMNIKLTAKGLALRKNTRDAKHLWLANALGQLDKREQATVVAAGKLLKRMVETS